MQVAERNTDCFCFQPLVMVFKINEIENTHGQLLEFLLKNWHLECIRTESLRNMLRRERTCRA
jgi:hypothetical protein